MGIIHLAKDTDGYNVFLVLSVDGWIVAMEDVGSGENDMRFLAEQLSKRFKIIHSASSEEHEHFGLN